MKIIVINGPNLNLLGKREVHIYGDQTFDDYFELLKTQFSEVDLSYFQSNHEGAIIDKIHEIGFNYDAIVINAGGLTHTSVALRDALAGVSAQAIEVHISNIHARESFREHSFLTPVCTGMITGLGLDGYRLAIAHLIQQK